MALVFKATRTRGSVCLYSQCLRNHPHIISLNPQLQVKARLTHRFQSTFVVDEQAEIVRKSEDQTAFSSPLNDEQRKLVDLILSGRNVFYTGAAGTGKSTVLRAVVRELERVDKIACVAAPTGRAALAVGGTTTWSFAGWSPSAHGHPLKELRRWARNREILSKTDILIIDEISMVENHHLERLNQVMKEAKAHAARNMGWAAMRKVSQEAFGGCQVVVSGDFCQLPPVCPFSNCIECGAELVREPSPSLGEPVVYRCPFGHGPWPDPHKWAFQSRAWREAKFAHIELREVHRQAKDPQFIQILGRMRQGDLTYDDIDTLTDPKRPTEDMTAAVRLYPTREEVRRYNSDQFKQLASKPYNYVALDSFHWNRAAHPELKHRGDRCKDGSLVALREHKFEQHVQLKKGMPVVLLANLSIDKGLVNGSQGRIIDFQHVSRKDICPLPAESDGDTMASYIRDVRERELMKFIHRLATTLFPVVEFFNGQRRVIIPDCATYEMGNELEKYFSERQYDTILTRFTYRPRPSLLCRTQIPLAPGWAMSVHKAQGMTLERVVVDLGRAFEDGQVYVAVSRARQLAGLKVEGDPRGLLVGRDGNREVMQFYRQRFEKGILGTPTTLTGQSDGGAY